MPSETEIEKVVELAERCEELLEKLPGCGVHFYDQECNEIATVSRFAAIGETIDWLLGKWRSAPLTEENVTELEKYVAGEDPTDEENEND